jgi:ParB family chromosome partitioning protein
VASARKGGLGRGLGALIGPASLDVGSEQRAGSTPPQPALEDGSVLLAIDPRSIRPNPKQPRQYFDEESLQELADSIRRDGLQEPVIVRKAGADFELVSGERRVRAAVLADLERIPAVCRDVSDEDMLKLGLIENIQREDLNPIETAKAYKALTAHFGWTQDDLAAQVGKKRATVTNTMRLLNLPADVQDLVIAGELSMGHARALLAVEPAPRQSTLARRIVQEGLSVRDVERIASAGPAPASRPNGPARKDPHVAEVEDELRRRLGTKVRLSANSAWKGKIEIEFFDLNELERLLKILRGR